MADEDDGSCIRTHDASAFHRSFQGVYGCAACLRTFALGPAFGAFVWVSGLVRIPHVPAFNNCQRLVQVTRRSHDFGLALSGPDWRT